MATRSISTFHQDSICDVCGRTLLRGEHTEAFLSGGRRYEVCELCKPRALHEGWVREGTIPDYPSTDTAPTRRGGLFRRRSRNGGSDRGQDAKRRGGGSLDDELGGDGWNAQGPAPERDRYESPYTEQQYGEPRYEQPRSAAAEPQVPQYEHPPALREPSAEHAGSAPSSYQEPEGSPPPRRPSRRGKPPHNHLSDFEARPLQFDGGSEEPNGYDRYEHDQPEEFQAGDSWLGAAQPGEAEIFDEQPRAATWEQQADAYEDWDERLEPAGEQPGEPQPQESERRRSEPPREPQPRGAGRSLFGRKRPGESRRSESPRNDIDSGLRGPREPRQVHAIPTDDVHRAAAALGDFNTSEYCRTISGVSRSLGEPVVNVTPDPNRAGSVWIVVSWELCWYRYEVDISDARASVRLDSQGYELSELTDEQQLANAVANASGQLTLA